MDYNQERLALEKQLMEGEQTLLKAHEKRVKDDLELAEDPKRIDELRQIHKDARNALETHFRFCRKEGYKKLDERFKAHQKIENEKQNVADKNAQSLDQKAERIQQQIDQSRAEKDNKKGRDKSPSKPKPQQENTKEQFKDAFKEMLKDRSKDKDRDR